MSPEDKIRNTLAELVIRDSFWGYLFSRIRRISSETLPYIMGVGVDPKGSVILAYNPSMVEEIPERELEVVLSHEGWHVLDKHFIRLSKILDEFCNKEKEAYLMRTWNQAADAAVNHIINAPDSLTIKRPDGKLYELIHAKKLGLREGQSAEYYFAALLQENPNNGEGNGSGSGSVEGCGDTLDDHSGWDLSKVEDKSLVTAKAEAEVKELIYKSFKSVRDKGNLPGNLKEKVAEMLAPPKVPYYQIIKKLVRGSRLDKIKKSYSKMNRKRSYAFFLGKDGSLPMLPFPGYQKDQTFKIVIGLDTSGSQSDEDIKIGLSATKDIIEKDRNCKTTVLEGDTCVSKEYDVKRVSDIQFEFSGRGGTVLAPMLERAKELKCDVALIFTDACCDDITQLPRSSRPNKIIWVIPKHARDDAIAGTGYIVRVDT